MLKNQSSRMLRETRLRGRASQVRQFVPEWAAEPTGATGIPLRIVNAGILMRTDVEAKNTVMIGGVRKEAEK